MPRQSQQSLQTSTSPKTTNSNVIRWMQTATESIASGKISWDWTKSRSPSELSGTNTLWDMFRGDHTATMARRLMQIHTLWDMFRGNLIATTARRLMQIHTSWDMFRGDLIATTARSPLVMILSQLQHLLRPLLRHQKRIQWSGTSPLRSGGRSAPKFLLAAVSANALFWDFYASAN